MLINSMLPEDLQSNDRTYNKKELNALIREVSIRDPEQYAEFVNKLKDLGRKSVYLQGATLKLEDFDPGFDKEAVYRRMDAELNATKQLKNVKEQKKRRLEIYAKFSDQLSDLAMKTGRARNSGLAGIIASGARGSPTQYRAMIATPALYTDYKDEPIDMFVRRSFGEGIRPIDMLASTFGTRKSTIATKTATADAGDLGKLFVQNAMPVMVNRAQSETPSGYMLDPDEDQLRGRVLARPVAGFKAGTIIDRKVEAAIQNKHKGRVMVHSALSEINPDGISSESFGVNFTGGLPGIGFAAGVTASNALSEPIAQSGLNTKHSGGAYTGGKKVFSGFDYLSQFVQIPDSFRDRAAVSEIEGKVSKIEGAPQGGQFVWVGDEKHYALPGLDVTVKVGDDVEPGDTLSDGLANPKDIIRLRGLGEGRRYYSRRLKRLLDDSGLDAQLRNTEVIARGALDAVQITDDGYGGHLPDSVVSYNKIAADWVPRKGHETRPTRQSTGRYLEQPLLHYTIGTKLTPRMTAEIEEAGFPNIKTHTEPAPFEPMQIRLRTNSYEVNDDWLARMGSSYLQKNLAESAQRGYDTNTKENTNPLPRIAVGKGFGDKVHETGKF